MRRFKVVVCEVNEQGYELFDSKKYSAIIETNYAIEEKTSDRAEAYLSIRGNGSQITIPKGKLTHFEARHDAH